MSVRLISHVVNLRGAVVLGFDADLQLRPLLECHVLDFL